MNGAVFSALAGGVDGAAPNMNGFPEEGLMSGAGAELGRWSNENPSAESGPKRGFGASGGVDAPDVGWTNEKNDFGGSAVVVPGVAPPKPAKDDTGALPNSGGDLAASTSAGADSETLEDSGPAGC